MENIKSKSFLRYSVGGLLIVVALTVLYVFVARPVINERKLAKCFSQISRENSLKSDDDSSKVNYPNDVFTYETVKDSTQDSVRITAGNDEIKSRVQTCHDKYGN